MKFTIEEVSPRVQKLLTTAIQPFVEVDHETGLEALQMVAPEMTVQERKHLLLLVADTVQRHREDTEEGLMDAIVIGMALGRVLERDGVSEDA